MPHDLPEPPASLDDASAPPTPRDRWSPLAGAMVCGMLVVLGGGLLVILGRWAWGRGLDGIALAACVLLMPGGLMMLLTGAIGVASAVWDLGRRDESR